MFRLVILVALAGCGRVSFRSSVDAADGDDADDGGVTPCNLASRLADDFGDGIADDELWAGSYADPGTSYAESGGNLILRPAANVASTYVGHVTFRHVDLHGQRISGQVAQLASGLASTGVGVDYDAGTSIDLFHKNGLLIASKRIAGTFTQLGTIPYDAAVHTFFAISERGGRIYFETSPDGTSFTSFVDVETPFDVTLVRAQLFAGTEGSVASPGEAHFASFNGGVAVAGATCHASALADRFDDGAIGHVWNNGFTDACCSKVESGGHLRIASTGAIGYSALRTAAGYDLRDDAVSVAAPVGPAATSMFYGALTARLDVNNELDIQISATGFTVRTLIGGTQSTFNLSRGAGENYVQLREAAGTFYFESSSDRQTWRLLRMQATPFSVADVLIGMEGGSYLATTASSIEFDDYNAP